MAGGSRVTREDFGVRGKSAELVTWFWGLYISDFPKHTEDYLARIWFREEEKARPVDAVARRRSEEGFAPAPLGLALRCKRIESEGRNARQARLVSAEDRLKPPRRDCILALGQGQHYFI